MYDCMRRELYYHRRISSAPGVANGLRSKPQAQCHPLAIPACSPEHNKTSSCLSSLTVFKASTCSSSYSQPLWRWKHEDKPHFVSFASCVYSICIAVVQLQATISTKYHCIMRQNSHTFDQCSTCCSVRQHLAASPGRLASAKCDITFLPLFDANYSAYVAVRCTSHSVSYVWLMHTYTLSRGRALH